MHTDLNRADVVAAIHANPTIPWLECSGRTPYGTLKYNYTWSDVYMEPYYQVFALIGLWVIGGGCPK
jgi:hypothetical protein